MRTIGILALALGLAAPTMAATPYDTRIDRVLKATPLIDGHNDWAENLREDFGEGWWAVDLSADSRTFKHPLMTDIPRLRAGHVGGQFWSVYVDARLSGAEAIKATLEQIDIVRGIAARYPTVFEMAYTAADVRRIHKAGRIASLIGVEGGAQMGESMPALRAYYALGARYMTLTHALTTKWADSATDNPQHDGLTPFGKAVVVEMNRLGMLIDLSHVAPSTMRAALAVSKAPVIFSHSSARGLDDHPRNVPDDVLKLLAANGGVVMVNYATTYVSAERNAWDSARAGAKASFNTPPFSGLYIGQPERAAAALVEWEKAHPKPPVTLAQVADHIEYIVKVAGHDHVGIGGDLDGIPETPEGLNGVDTYPALLAELMKRGWSDVDIAKLAGGNVLRALEGAEKVAASMRGTAPTTRTIATLDAPAK
ncbi:dipeptidase [Sphingosinicellaceae bacterium]|nr:dipeptidase [Sphingosinicellaceae bacterium]